MTAPDGSLAIPDFDPAKQDAPRAHLPKRLVCRDRDLARAARRVKALANEKRLAIVCRLAAAGEMCVHALAAAAALSSSATSQHLAILRRSKIVATRREARTIHYRLADPRVGQLLGALQVIGEGGSPSAALPDEQ